MPKITLPYNYLPRSYHRRIYAAHQRGVRHLCLVIHRRGGKTESMVAYAPAAMIETKGNYAHVFPQLRQGREVVWDGIGRSGMRYIEHFPQPLLYGTPNKSELKITLRDVQKPRTPGSTYQLKGTDSNINALVGGGTRGIIWDEYSLQNPLARDYARPILAENDGWEIVIFTPRGENHAYDLYTFALAHPETWHVEYLTVEHTKRDAPGEDGGPVITVEAIEEHRRELLARGRDDADAIIEQEYFLSWQAPMPGAYYAREMRWLEQQGRITQVPYDPNLPVYTAWDLGRNDLNAIWFFQPAGNEIRFIDYVQQSNLALVPDPRDPSAANWIQIVRAKPYCYDHSRLPQPLTVHKHEVHYGPHDLEVHEYSTNKTRYGLALEHGLRFTVLPHPGPGGLADGIATARQLLRRAVFDREKCRLGLSALRSYHREWDGDKQTYSDTPVHDWASNGADAFRYAAVGLMPPGKPLQPQVQGGSWEQARRNVKRAQLGLPVRSFKIGGT